MRSGASSNIGERMLRSRKRYLHGGTLGQSAVMKPEECDYDAIGEDALLALSEAPKFNRWMFTKIRQYIGDRVLEVGAGIGNITKWIRAEKIFATDCSDRRVDTLREKFVSAPHVTVDRFNLAGEDRSRFSSEKIDTVLCLNVLEHIEKDDESVRLMSDLLVPSGRLILLVPFSQTLYCEIDRQLGHFRRYSRERIREVVSGNGFTVERIFLFNLFGGIGWYVHGKIFRGSKLNPGLVHAFEKFVPLFRIIEFCGTPFGASIVCIARKNTPP